MSRRLGFALLGLGVAVLSAPGAATAEPAPRAKPVFWHVKAIHPSGRTLDVKAVGPDGTRYDVKAIEEDDNVHMLDVKAFVGKRRKPVKILVSNDRHAPIQAVGVRGHNLDLKAITPEGKLIDVKGVRWSGNVIHIKAISKGGRFFAVKALAPDGRVYDVKGIKMLKDRTEMLIGAVRVHAHVKAIPPARRE